MRRLLIPVAVAALAGCQQAPYDEQVQAFQEQILAHFENLNAESALAAMESLRRGVPADEATYIGRTFSAYHWRPDGFILFDVECGTCRVRQDVVTYLGAEVKCPACGAGTMEDRALTREPLLPAGLQQNTEELKKRGKVVPMFEIKSGQDLPIVALVRYVRRQAQYDELGRLSDRVKDRLRERLPSPEIVDRPASGTAYVGGGLHRPDVLFIGRTAFVYRGGTALQIDRDSVRKLERGERVEVSEMTLGSTVGIEERHRPWLEKPPVPDADRGP